MTPRLSLKRMEEYCAKATPGPWFADGDYVIDTFDFHPKDAPEEAVAIVQFGKLKNSYFIANARTDLPALLSWAKRARRFIESYGRWYAHVPDHYRNECTIMGYQERKYLLEECGE